MCCKSQYVKPPDSKREKTENGPDQSEKKKLLTKILKKKLIDY